MMTSDANPWLDLSIPLHQAVIHPEECRHTPHSFFGRRMIVAMLFDFSCDLETRVKLDEPRLYGIEIEQHIKSDSSLV